MLRRTRRSGLFPIRGILAGAPLHRVVSGTNRMRLRMLLIVLVTVFALAMALTWWPLRSTTSAPEDSALPHSADLKVSFLGCTNGTATIQVRNRGSQPVYLTGYVALYARDTNRAAGCRWLCSRDFTNRLTVPLGPGTGVTVCFPAPTNGVPRRATVGGAGSVRLPSSTP